MPTLGIIGGGNMGAAIVRGCVRARVLRPDEIIVAEIDAAKRNELASLGCQTTDDPKLAAVASQVLLAVKPQVFASVAANIRDSLKAEIVISIMAGLHSRSIRTALGGQVRVIRAMPNTPCQIGAGMTGLALGDGAKPGDEALSLSIFNALGRTVMLDESLMYAVTAVSASGPAYVFLLAEAMEKSALALGIPREAARLLVEQTVMGAGRLLSESDHDAAALRKAVTSPGGTTAAALEVMGAHDFEGIVIKALTRARDRGIELDRS